MADLVGFISFSFFRHFLVQVLFFSHIPFLSCIPSTVLDANFDFAPDF